MQHITTLLKYTKQKKVSFTYFNEEKKEENKVIVNYDKKNHIIIIIKDNDVIIRKGGKKIEFELGMDIQQNLEHFLSGYHINLVEENTELNQESVVITMKSLVAAVSYNKVLIAYFS